MLQERCTHPAWGARKIVARFKRRFARATAPSRSAVSQLFKRAGLSEAVSRRRKPERAGGAHAPVSEPNALWTIDFKGHFRTRDHRYCYPLTVMDAATRYLLACRGGLNTRTGWVMSFVDQLFKEYGLPTAIHSDNGSPFACYASVGRLSRLSLHWLKLGIAIERSRPACPQDNPAHERMHRTLKAHTTLAPRGPSGASANTLRSLPTRVQPGASTRSDRLLHTGRAVPPQCARLSKSPAKP